MSIKLATRMALSWGPLTLAAVLATAASAATSNDPLAGDVIYYFDYSDDGVTGSGFINDRTGNFHDLQTFAPEPFVFDSPSLSFLLPDARVLDLTASNHGALTDFDPLGNQQLSDAGGYSFETYIKRDQDTPGLAQHIWNPEGMHSIEILPDGGLQFAVRGLAAFVVPVDTVLPLGEWHHLMAVMEVATPLPPASANPGVGGDPLVVTYKLYVDGDQVGSTLGPVDLNASFSGFENSPNQRHGIGSQEFGSNINWLRGELAMTRLSLGALTLQQSLIDVAVAGDTNEDGKVNIEDLNNVRNNFGGTGLGDTDGDGIVGITDLNAVRNNFGAGQPSPVPEPSTYALATIGLVGVAGVIRQRKRR